MLIRELHLSMPSTPSQPWRKKFCPLPELAAPRQCSFRQSEWIIIRSTLSPATDYRGFSIMSSTKSYYYLGASIIYLETPFSASTGVVKQRFRLNKKKTLSFKRYRVKKTNWENKAGMLPACPCSLEWRRPLTECSLTDSIYIYCGESRDVS